MGGRQHVASRSPPGQLLAAVVMVVAVAVTSSGRSADTDGTSAPLSAPASEARLEATSAPVSLVTTRPASAPPTQPATAAPATMVAADPIRLHIPSIGLESELMDLGLQADGSLEVPPSGFPAGWYTGAPTPGELGPAVIAGHVDWGGQPGVFFDLRDLSPGDDIAVTREDGSTARFRVTLVEQVDKDAFPTQAVYGDLDHAGLRLITCGGEFDARMRSYEDNLVVFAELVGGAPTRVADPRASPMPSDAGADRMSKRYASPPGGGVMAAPTTDGSRVPQMELGWPNQSVPTNVSTPRKAT